MATRKVKDAKDLSTNELIYFKGHAKATYMSDGTTVEDTINNINIDLLVPITYSELKALHDDYKLVPGMQYRITDYTTTTTQTNTKSANHQFDIIVTANNENALSYLARAIQHTNDTYFANCNLSAWQIWYDINNDTTKYAWADETNGKGVIYRMIDEHNNDCPYDFKNILFYTDKYSYNNTADNYYTFSYYVNNILYDGTVEYQVKNCYNNIINKYLNSNKQELNCNIFRNLSFGDNCYSNTFGNNCYSNIFRDNCYSNTFGDNCYSNDFQLGCYSNTLGNYCYSNDFQISCYSNTLGNYCYSNTFVIYSQYNIFGNSCHSNNFSEYCQYNTFGNNCYSNTFGGYCQYNTFGNNCYSNTFKSSCYSNTFGDSCSSNTFGNRCYSNTFGDSCSSNTFGESKTSPKSYYRYIIFDNGNSYINLFCTITTASSRYYQNIRIGLGVNNTTSTKTITDSNVGQRYETCYKPANSQTITI